MSDQVLVLNTGRGGFSVENHVKQQHGLVGWAWYFSRFSLDDRAECERGRGW